MEKVWVEKVNRVLDLLVKDCSGLRLVLLARHTACVEKCESKLSGFPCLPKVLQNLVVLCCIKFQILSLKREHNILLATCGAFGLNQ